MTLPEFVTANMSLTLTQQKWLSIKKSQVKPIRRSKAGSHYFPNNANNTRHFRNAPDKYYCFVIFQFIYYFPRLILSEFFT